MPVGEAGPSGFIARALITLNVVLWESVGGTISVTGQTIREA